MSTDTELQERGQSFLRDVPHRRGARVPYGYGVLHEGTSPVLPGRPDKGLGPGTSFYHRVRYVLSIRVL